MQAGKTEGFSNYVTFETTGQLREPSWTQNPKPEEENEEEEEVKRSKCSCSWRSGYSCWQEIKKPVQCSWMIHTVSSEFFFWKKGFGQSSCKDSVAQSLQLLASCLQTLNAPPSDSQHFAAHEMMMSKQASSSSHPICAQSSLACFRNRICTRETSGMQPHGFYLPQGFQSTICMITRSIASRYHQLHHPANLLSTIPWTILNFCIMHFGNVPKSQVSPKKSKRWTLSWI